MKVIICEEIKKRGRKTISENELLRKKKDETENNVDAAV